MEGDFCMKYNDVKPVPHRAVRVWLADGSRVLGMWTGTRWWSTKGEINPVNWELEERPKKTKKGKSSLLSGFLCDNCLMSAKGFRLRRALNILLIAIFFDRTGSGFRYRQNSLSDEFSWIDVFARWTIF